jgi:hypothetical protein
LRKQTWAAEHLCTTPRTESRVHSYRVWLPCPVGLGFSGLRGHVVSPGRASPTLALACLPALVSRSENRPQVRLENGDPTIRSPYPSVNKRPSRGNNRVFGRRTLGVFLQAKRAEMDARSSEFSCRRPARSESRLLSSASASSSTKTEETPYVHRLRHVLFRRTHG